MMQGLLGKLFTLALCWALSKVGFWVLFGTYEYFCQSPKAILEHVMQGQILRNAKYLIKYYAEIEMH